MELVLFLFQWIDHIKIGNCLSAEFEGKVSFNCSVETGILKGFQSKILGQESLHHMALEEWPVLETVGEGWCQEAADNGLLTCVQSFTASVDLDYDSRGQGEQGSTLKPWWWSQEARTLPPSHQAMWMLSWYSGLPVKIKPHFDQRKSPEYDEGT